MTIKSTYSTIPQHKISQIFSLVSDFQFDFEIEIMENQFLYNTKFEKNLTIDLFFFDL